MRCLHNYLPCGKKKLRYPESLAKGEKDDRDNMLTLEKLNKKKKEKNEIIFGGKKTSM
jgi:hypothetical protein